MLIEKSNIQKDCMLGKTVLLTGAGGGIGYEAARALVWMGANVIIAEIDEKRGLCAAKKINEESDTERAYFYQIDISDEKQIDGLHTFIKSKYGYLDVIFNNAAIAPIGAADDVPIGDWDKSYAVNLRAPILFTQKFLPDMKVRNQGTIVFVPSSGAAPYMGAYEIFKTAQVELCNTLIGELENTNIYTYSIGPGLVNTETARRGIEKVASFMGISTDEFYAMNKAHILDAESAGAGFAVSVVFAKKYNGQEIGSIQALIDAGMPQEKEEEVNGIKNFSLSNKGVLKEHIANAVKTYNEQYSGWLQRNIFERQWILRDFKKTVMLSAEQAGLELENAYQLSSQEDFYSLSKKKGLFISLREYYKHQYKLLQGYEKDVKKLKENSRYILKWVDELQWIIDSL